MESTTLDSQYHFLDDYPIYCRNDDQRSTVVSCRRRHAQHYHCRPHTVTVELHGGQDFPHQRKHLDGATSKSTAKVMATETLTPVILPLPSPGRHCDDGPTAYAAATSAESCRPRVSGCSPCRGCGHGLCYTCDSVDTRPRCRYYHHHRRRRLHGRST